MGINGLKLGWKAHRGSWDHGCILILSHFGWWGGGKLWEVGDGGGGEDIPAE